MMTSIVRLTGREILDSRGRPTVEATCLLRDGSIGTASVPSGASTGSAEANELRDGDLSRYGGLGCRRAAENISTELNLVVCDQSFETQQKFDQRLIDCDGTHNKSRIGANAILASSIAFARAMASHRRLPLYQYFATIADQSIRSLPELTVNLFSGGIHAGGQVPVQDVLLVPVGATTIDESLSMVASVYQAAAKLTLRKYGMRMLRADEGGLAPTFPDAEAMLSDTVESIREAGLEPGSEMAIAVDVASTHFYREGRYQFGQEILDSRQMIDRLEQWVSQFPIVSIEDGLAENDWDAWPELLSRLGTKIMVLGDDLLCTHPDRIKKAIATNSANALLLKVNQIGTLSEAADSLKLARAARWHITVSARSGETEDNWLADLAVGWQGNQIKVGSITQSERLSKYNRLLGIESETNLPITAGLSGW